MLAIKAKLSTLNQQIQEQQAALRILGQEQARLRENLKVLGKSEDEKKLLTRYVNKFAESEDQIEKVKQQEATLVEQRSTVQRQLDEKIRSLTFNHTINWASQCDEAERLKYKYSIVVLQITSASNLP